MRKPITEEKFNAIKEEIEKGRNNFLIVWICSTSGIIINRVRKSKTYKDYLKFLKGGI